MVLLGRERLCSYLNVPPSNCCVFLSGDFCSFTASHHRCGLPPLRQGHRSEVLLSYFHLRVYFTVCWARIIRSLLLVRREQFSISPACVAVYKALLPDPHVPGIPAFSTSGGSFLPTHAFSSCRVFKDTCVPLHCVRYTRRPFFAKYFPP